MCDRLLRKTLAGLRPRARLQVSRYAGLSGSDRGCPAAPGSSGTQRTRRQRWRTIAGIAVPARTVQGMACARSGQAPAWPLVSDRSVRSGSGVKRDFVCAFTTHF